MGSIRAAKKKLDKWKKYYSRYDHLVPPGELYKGSWGYEKACRQYSGAIQHVLRKDFGNNPELIQLLERAFEDETGRDWSDPKGTGVRADTFGGIPVCTCAACRTNKDRADS